MLALSPRPVDEPTVLMLQASPVAVACGFPSPAQDYYDGPSLAPPHSHPVDQSVPGPADRLPADWQRHVH